MCLTCQDKYVYGVVSDVSAWWGPVDKPQMQKKIMKEGTKGKGKEKNK